MARIDLAFTSTADPYTESAYLHGEDPVGIRAPILAGTAAGIRIENSDNWDEDQGDVWAAWEEVEDETGAAIEIAASTTKAVRRCIAHTKWMSLVRVRLRAVTGAGADSNQTSGTVSLFTANVRR